MSRWRDERAVTVQIGAVLLLAILVSAMAIWQANAVPAENRDVEFEHNQLVQEQLLDLRNGIVASTDGTRRGSYAISLGTSYPTRSVFINPPPPTGTLRTVGTDDDSIAITLENATASDADVRDFWNGTTRTLETGALVYRPSYNEHTSAPATIYEHSVLYTHHDNDATVPLSGQQVVDGTRLSLLSLDGDFHERGRSTALDLRYASASDTTVSIRNDDDPVAITVPTRLSNATWERLLEDDDQFVGQGGHVQGVERTGTTIVDGVAYNLVTIRLEPGVTYALEMARVGIGSDVSDEAAAYLTRIDGDGDTIATGEDHELVVEVRDRFNNPVVDEVVNASVRGDGVGVVTSQAETDSDGRAILVYNSSVETEDGETIEVSIGDGDDDRETVEFVVTVEDESSSSGDGSGGTYSLGWNESAIDDQPGTSCDEPDGSAADCAYNLEAGDSTALTAQLSRAIEGVSVDYGLESGGGASLSPGSGETDSDGRNATTISFSDDARDGDLVTVHANSGGSGDELTIRLERASGSIAGVVTDADDGSPIADAVVDVESTGQTATTNADGEYAIDDVPAGDHDVTANADGYAPETAAVTVGEGETTQNFDLEQSPYFVVTIDGTNSPVEEGQSLEVETTVENRGATGVQTIVLETADGTERDTQTIDLGGDDATTVVLEWATQSGDGSDDEYTVVVRSENTSDAENVRVESGSAGLEDGTVLAVAQSPLGNNERIDSSFTLDTGTDTYDVHVSLLDQAGGGGAGSGGRGWQTKQVTIDGTVLELETGAADDIGVNLVERDLLDETTYAGGDTSILESIQNEIDGSSEIRNETHAGSTDLVVTIGER